MRAIVGVLVVAASASAGGLALLGGAGTFAGAFAVLGTSGCTFSLADSGADSGSDGAVTTETAGEQCNQILAEFCMQATNRCGIGGFSVDQCISNDLSSCCDGPSPLPACSAVSTFPSSDVSSCTAVIETEDCDLIATSSQPSACAEFFPPTQ